MPTSWPTPVRSGRRGPEPLRATASAPLSEDGLAAVLAPRDGLVRERAEPGPAGTVVFHQLEGPLAAYRRTVTVPPPGRPGPVTQVVEGSVGVPYVSWLFAPLVRRHLGALDPPARRPWWAPPGTLPHADAVTLAALCAFSALAGYLGDLLPTVMTYAGREFGVGDGGQSLALGVVQVNAVVALALLARADRAGRRRVLLGCMVVAAVLTGIGALSPSLVTLTAGQVVATSLVTAADVLVGVMAVEEMPRDCRAWAIALVTMSFGLGGGVALAVLPVAGVDRSAWRWLFVIGLLAVPAAFAVARHLPESERWIAERATPGPPARFDPALRRRLLLLGAGALLFAVFDAPSGQLQNQYLRTERHWSATRISLSEQIAGTVGGLGSLAGGRLADTRGRRPVAAAAVLVATAATLAEYLTRGAGLYLWMTVASVAGYAATPALAVYGAELFPTAWRGRAGGALTVLGAAGGLGGLAAAGGLADVIGSIGPALAVLAVAPVALVVLVVRAYPETAGRSLEALSAPARAPDPEPNDTPDR